MKKLRMMLIAVYLMSFSAPLVTMGQTLSNNSTPVTQKETKATFKVKDSQVVLNSNWTPKDNFESATDIDGKKLNWKELSNKVKVVGSVDTNKIGVYKVTYTLDKVSQTVAVEVVKKLKIVEPKKAVQPEKKQIVMNQLKAKNVVVPLNTFFDISSAFDSSVGVDGNDLSWKDVSMLVKVDNTVDVSKVGTYKVTFSYGNLVAVSEVSVIAIPIKINLKPVTLEVGTQWNNQNAFVSVEMSDGQLLNWEDVNTEVLVDQSPDTSKPGRFNITYTYKGISAITIVTVVANPVVPIEVKVVDKTINMGDTWTPENNFQSVIMSDGTKLVWKDVAQSIVVNGQVDTSKAGNYSINYTYEDKVATAVVTVKEVEKAQVQQILVKDSAFIVGGNWQASDNFNYVLMSDGSKLSWQNVKNNIVVKGNVEVKKVGTYHITYEYGGKSAVATVSVKEAPVTVKVQEILVKNSTVVVGENWQASDNYNYVLMSDGSKLSWEDVQKNMKVNGSVDTKKVGTYKVVYEYFGQSATATIVVKEKIIEDVHSIFVKNSTIQLGNNWQASDNFVGVRLANGTELLWKDVAKDIIVKGTVDTNKLGEYKVSYSYGDKTETAVIQVIKNTVPMTNDKKLPQTGEKDKIVTYIVGIGFLFSSFILFTLRIWKQGQ